MKKQLNDNSITIEKQFGFRKNRSCEMSISTLINKMIMEWKTKIDEGITKQTSKIWYKWDRTSMV